MYLTTSGSVGDIAETWYITVMIKTCNKSNSFEGIWYYKEELKAAEERLKELEKSEYQAGIEEKKMVK